MAMAESNPAPIAPLLNGVPETMLWPLYNRAFAASQSNPILHDPLSIELTERIDYDFEARFGKASIMHAIRARRCDELVTDYLRLETRKPTVVALGEGLDSQLWRLGDAPLQWISVDVPEAIALRDQLLPPDPRVQHIACSAMDFSWMDHVPATSRPFISASGLLMYFSNADVAALLEAIAARFPDAQLFFDTIPPGFSRRTMQGMQLTQHYTTPPMPWGITIGDIPRFLRSVQGLLPVSVQTYADPYPQYTKFYKALSLIPPLRNRLAPALVHARVVDPHTA